MEMDKTFGTYSSFAPLCIRGPPNKSTRNSLLSALFDKFRIVGKPIKHTGYIMINISQAFLLDRGRGKTYLVTFFLQNIQKRAGDILQGV